MPSKIEWTDETWNPVTGCTKCSEGCKHCYAARMAKRLAGRFGYPEGDGFAVTVHLDRMSEPLRWKKKERRVFVCSMSDLFHEDVPDYVIDMVWAAMLICQLHENLPRHIFQVLTKRPQRMRDHLRHPDRLEGIARAAGQAMEDGDGWHDALWEYASVEHPHIWLGVTAENQQRADERIPLLLQTPAAVRFVSVEPMLGPVNLRHMDAETAGHDEMYFIDSLTGRHDDMGRPCRDVEKLDWVICGGETGPGSRMMMSPWAKGLRDQCLTADVPFFFKQWGDWYGEMKPDEPTDPSWVSRAFPEVQR